MRRKENRLSSHQVILAGNSVKLYRSAYCSPAGSQALNQRRRLKFG